MTALAAARIIKERLAPSVRRFPVAASVVCWEGGIVALSGAGSSAVATPGAATAALKIVGVARATADNRTGAAGAQTVEAAIGVFLMNNDGADPVALGDIGAAVYVTDDNTVAKTSASGAKPQAGTLFDIDPSGGVWVKFA